MDLGFDSVQMRRAKVLELSMPPRAWANVVSMQLLGVVLPFGSVYCPGSRVLDLGQNIKQLKVKDRLV